MKKIIFLFFAIFLLSAPLFMNSNISNSEIVYADIQEDFNNTLDDQLSDLDFSSIEQIIDNLTDTEKTAFGDKSFLEKIYMILSS